jgi:hypothetical protein
VDRCQRRVKIPHVRGVTSSPLGKRKLIITGSVKSAIKNNPPMQIELSDREIKLIELATNELDALPYGLNTIGILKLLQTLNEKVAANKIAR